MVLIICSKYSASFFPKTLVVLICSNHQVRQGFQERFENLFDRLGKGLGAILSFLSHLNICTFNCFSRKKFYHMGVMGNLTQRNVNFISCLLKFSTFAQRYGRFGPNLTEYFYLVSKSFCCTRKFVQVVFSYEFKHIGRSNSDSDQVTCCSQFVLNPLGHIIVVNLHVSFVRFGHNLQLCLHSGNCDPSNSNSNDASEQRLPSVKDTIPTTAAAGRIYPKITFDRRPPSTENNTRHKSAQRTKQKRKAFVRILHALPLCCNRILRSFDGLGKGMVL